MFITFKLKCFFLIIIFFAWLSPLIASSGNFEKDDKSLLKSSNLLLSSQPPLNKDGEEKTDNKRRIYHSRESHSYKVGVSLGGGSVVGYGPKPREGGLGPLGSIEISPWVKSVNWVKNTEEGRYLEFVFDPDIHAAYVGVNLEKVMGHCHLSNIASVKNPFGGNIRRINDSLFRTDESSGHFGAKWNDEVRFKFIEMMAIKNLKVLHEPWVRDSVVSEKLPSLYCKKIACGKYHFNENDYKLLREIEEHSVFSKFSDRALSIYQDNFLRKFGNSIFNPTFPVSMSLTPWSTPPPSPILYAEDNETLDVFHLKGEFRDKGSLDMKFYNPEHGFIEPEKLEGMLFEYFKDQIKNTTQ